MSDTPSKTGANCFLFRQAGAKREAKASVACEQVLIISTDGRAFLCSREYLEQVKKRFAKTSSRSHCSRPQTFRGLVTLKSTDAYSCSPDHVEVLNADSHASTLAHVTHKHV